MTMQKGIFAMALLLAPFPNLGQGRPMAIVSRVQSAFVASPRAPSVVRTKISKFGSMPHHIIRQSSSTLFLSSEIRRDEEENPSSLADPKGTTGSPEDEESAPPIESTSGNWFTNLVSESPLRQFQKLPDQKPPPMLVEDTTLLYYDILLILNMSLSISFWVVHRMQFEYIASAVSEGSLFAILWIISGLWHGAFLNSAIDGHFGSTSDQGGPRAAGLLGLHTFITASNLRILVALAMAVVEHRKVGALFVGEQLIPREIVVGLILMSVWRALHSSAVPRL